MREGGCFCCKARRSVRCTGAGDDAAAQQQQPRADGPPPQQDPAKPPPPSRSPFRPPSASVHASSFSPPLHTTPAPHHENNPTLAFAPPPPLSAPFLSPLSSRISPANAPGPLLRRRAGSPGAAIVRRPPPASTHAAQQKRLIFVCSFFGPPGQLPSRPSPPPRPPRPPRTAPQPDPDRARSSSVPGAAYNHLLPPPSPPLSLSPCSTATAASGWTPRPPRSCRRCASRTSSTTRRTSSRCRASPSGVFLRRPRLL